MYRYIKLWAYAVSVNIYNCRNKKSCENTVSLKVQYFFSLSYCYLSYNNYKKKLENVMLSKQFLQ